MIAHVLDFCAICGELVPEDENTRENPHCHNRSCYADLTERGSRVQGIFSAEDAATLRKANGQ